MAAGTNASMNRTTLDAALGAIPVEVLRSLEKAVRMHTFLLSKTDEELTDAQQWNYTQTDVDNIRSAYGALNKLHRIATAQDVIANPDDHFYFAKRISGFNL